MMDKNSQCKRLFELLRDGLAHNTIEICSEVYGGERLLLARVGARVWDLRKKGYDIRGSWAGAGRERRYVYQYFPPRPQTEEEKKVEMDSHLIQALM